MASQQSIDFWAHFAHRRAFRPETQAATIEPSVLCPSNMSNEPSGSDGVAPISSKLQLNQKRDSLTRDPATSNFTGGFGLKKPKKKSKAVMEELEPPAEEGASGFVWVADQSGQAEEQEKGSEEIEDGFVVVSAADESGK